VWWLVLVLGSGLLGVLVVRRTLVVVTVEGTSMSPTYQWGDRLLVRRRSAAALRCGDVVLLRPDATETSAIVGRPTHVTADSVESMVKRVAALPGMSVPADLASVVRAGTDGVVPADCLIVLGDNPDGRDSRVLGYISTRWVVGVVVRRLSATVPDVDSAAS
jgi:signal peptidase I